MEFIYLLIACFTVGISIRYAFAKWQGEVSKPLQYLIAILFGLVTVLMFTIGWRIIGVVISRLALFT